MYRIKYSYVNYTVLTLIHKIKWSLVNFMGIRVKKKTFQALSIQYNIYIRLRLGQLTTIEQILI